MKRLRKLCIGDGAGSFFDKQSRGPVFAIRKTLQQMGINATEDQIRIDMGLPKPQHWSKLFQMPDIAKQFQMKHGTVFSNHHLPFVLKSYQTNQMETLAKNFEFTKLVDGAHEFVSFLHKHNINIAMTTGYNRETLDLILNSLATQGFQPDFAISSSEASSRCEMNQLTCQYFGVLPQDTIAFGDTIHDLKGARWARIQFCGIENEFCDFAEFEDGKHFFTVDDIRKIKYLF